MDSTFNEKIPEIEKKVYTTPGLAEHGYLIEITQGDPFTGGADLLPGHELDPGSGTG